MEEDSDFKSRYLDILATLQDTKAELDDFQTSSKELEEELERELAATEAAQEDLKRRISKLEGEKEEWKAKHLSAQKSHNLALGSLQRELDAVKAERDRFKVSLRDLEMGVDDLERNERMVSSSLQDMEARYNRAIEDKTLLEQELIDKQELEEEMQRLKDEMRDLLSEMSVLKEQRLKPPPPPSPPPLALPSKLTSPVRELSDELSLADLMVSPSAIPGLPGPPSPSPLSTFIHTQSPGLPRSNTSPSISRIASPSRLPVPGGSPNKLPRSTTTRHLSLSSTITARTAVASPLGSTLRPRQPQVAPPRLPAVDSKSRGVRMVSDLGERVRTLQNRIQTHNVPKVRKLNPAGTVVPGKDDPLALPRPTPAHPRMHALSDNPHRGLMNGGTPGTPGPGDWVLVSEAEESPTAIRAANGLLRPSSRSVSGGPSASHTKSSSIGTHLPPRPGVSSPLASSKHPSSSAVPIQRRPSSRLTTSSTHTQSSIPSRAITPTFLTLPPQSTTPAPIHFPRSPSSSSSCSSSPPNPRPSLSHARPSISHTRPPTNYHSKGDGVLKRSTRRISLIDTNSSPTTSRLPPPRASLGSSVGRQRPVSAPVPPRGGPPPVPPIPARFVKEGGGEGRQRVRTRTGSTAGGSGVNGNGEQRPRSALGGRVRSTTASGGVSGRPPFI